MSESKALWRGNEVAVLAKTTKTAVIVTPLSIHLSVSVSELRDAPATKRVKRDSRKF